MKIEISRHQLKKDELLEFIGRAVLWAKNNPQNALTIGGGILLAVIFGIYFYVHYQNIQKFVSDRLSYASNAYYYGKLADDSLKALDEIIRSYPRSPFTTQALLLRAQIYLDKQNFPQALADCEAVINRKKPKEVIPLGYIQLAAVQQRMGNYPAAIATYNEFLTRYPEHFYAVYVYDSLGTIYLAMNNTNDARSAYEKIVTMYPGSFWARKAQMLMGALTSQTTAPAASK